MQLAVLSKAEATVSFCCRYGECLGCCQEREATLRADLARVTAEREEARVQARTQARRFIRLADDKPYLARRASPLCEELAEAQAVIDATSEVSNVKLALTRGLARAYRDQRDAARAQVRELQKVARAAVAVRNGTLGAVRGLDRAVLALPPSMLEEPSDG